MPNANIFAVFDTPQQAFLQQLQTVLYGLPGRRGIAGEDRIFESTVGVVASLQNLCTQTIGLSEKAPSLPGEQDLVKQVKVMESYTPLQLRCHDVGP